MTKITLENIRTSGNYAISNTILGDKAHRWQHKFIVDDAVPSCDIDNGIIYVPSFGTIINPDDDRMVRAKTAHEALHGLLTPVNKNPKWSDFKANLVNSLEDNRIEKAMEKISPILKGDLNFLNSSIGKKINRQLSDKVNGGESLKPLNELTIALHLSASGVFPQWQMTAEGAEMLKICQPIYDGWRDVQNIDNPRGFYEIEKIADRIIEALKDYMNNDGGDDSGGEESQDADNNDKPQDKSQDSGQGADNSLDNSDADSGGDGDSGDSGSGEGEEEESGEDGDDGEGADGAEDGDDSGGGSTGENSGGDGEGEECGDGQEGDEAAGGDNGGDSQDDGEDGGEETASGNDSAPDKPGDSGKSNKSRRPPRRRPHGGNDNANFDKEVEENFDADDDLFEDALREKLRQIRDDSQSITENYRPFTNFDRVIRADEDKYLFFGAHKLIAGVIGQLSAHTENVLKAQSRCKQHRFLEKGRLDKRQLVAISKNLSRQVFYKQTQGLDLNVAVTILIDESGSTLWFINQMRALAIAFSEVFHKLGIKFEVLGYTTGVNNFNVAPRGVSRTSENVIFEHKRFDENYLAEKFRLGSINSHNCNIDGESLVIAFKRNMEQRANRHIIFVLSDGLPNASFGSRESVIYKNLHDSVAFVRRNGAEVYAFGIRTNAPADFYGKENFVHIDDIKQMGGKFFDSFRNVMTKK